MGNEDAAEAAPKDGSWEDALQASIPPLISGRCKRRRDVLGGWEGIGVGLLPSCRQSPLGDSHSLGFFFLKISTPHARAYVCARVPAPAGN